jgi:hypothetical protein
VWWGSRSTVVVLLVVCCGQALHVFVTSRLVGKATSLEAGLWRSAQSGAVQTVSPL